MSVHKKLKANVIHYHQIIRNAFDQFWFNKIGKQLYDENKFLELFNAPRDIFLDYCGNNKLNYSSVAGTIQEWTLFHFLNAGLNHWRKNKVALVINRHQIPFSWKKRGTSKINIDVVIKNIKTSKIYYAFELKTNFEDSFNKYLSEEQHMYHHRTKPYRPFKYYYLSLSIPSKSIRDNYMHKLNTLVRREELYVLNKDEKELPGAKIFLKSIEAAIQNIK